MTTFLRTRLFASAVLCIGGLAALSGPAMAAGSIKAAYVETVIPAKTFYGTLFLTSGPKATGPGVSGGILGISSITITNFDAQPQQVFFSTPIFSGPGCNASIIGGTNPQLTVIVQGRSTLQLTFPTPLVVNPQNGATCLSAEVTTGHTGAVEVNFIGVVN
jgi:hypothetical protein